MMGLNARFRMIWTRFGAEFSLGLLVVLPALAWISGRDVGTAILWATGVVLLAYTIETQGMRLEMVRQNEITIQPLVIARIRGTEEGQDRRYDERLILRNIGKGPALFVQVKDIEVQEVEGFGRFVARFFVVDCIEADKDVVADVEFDVIPAGGAFEAPGRRGYDFIASLNPRSARGTYEVIISYEDIGGERRWSKVQMGKGGIRLLYHGKGTVSLSEGRAEV